MFWGRPQPEQGRGLGWCRDRCLQTPSHPPALTPPGAAVFHATFCTQHVLRTRSPPTGQHGNQCHLEVPLLRTSAEQQVVFGVSKPETNARRSHRTSEQPVSPSGSVPRSSARNSKAVVFGVAGPRKQSKNLQDPRPDPPHEPRQ